MVWLLWRDTKVMNMLDGIKYGQIMIGNAIVDRTSDVNAK